MIRPTFLAFETAKRALSVSQAGLDTVGHNISNANTPGYTRQRVDQVSISAGGTSTKYQIFGRQTSGLGADIQGISQIRDPYLDNRYRTEATNNGELGVKSDGLLDINNIFDEIMSNGLHAKMGDLINAIDIFAQQADSKELAMVVRNTASELAKMLNKNAAQLEEALVQQKADLNATVNEKVNSIIEQIAALNKQIKEDNFYGNPANELNDERNMLIDQLAEYVDIKVVRTPVKVSKDLTVEQVSIELKDSGDAAKNIPNALLVDGSQYNKFAVSEVTEGPNAGNVKITLVDGTSGYEIDIDGNHSNGTNGDVTSKLYKGGIKGFIDIINGAGPGAGNGVSTFRGIPYYQASLDEYAQKLAEVFNRINNISAEEAANSGTSYAPILTGSATGWAKNLTSGTIDFSGKQSDLSFAYDGTNITASFTNSSGVPQNYTSVYNQDGTIDFMDLNDPTQVAFSITTYDDVPATASTSLHVDAGYPPLLTETLDKNLFAPIDIPFTFTPANQPSWVDSFAAGARQFSGSSYDMTFTMDSPNPGEITAVLNDGTTYTGVYQANGTVDFIGADNKVGFSIKTTANAPPASSGLAIDATITAKNIGISSSWLKDELYLTTTKKNPVTQAKAELTLTGNSNPSWLKSVELSSTNDSVPNGSYVFKFSGTDPNRQISVDISGVTYTGTYAKDSTIELTNTATGNIGIVITTNGRDLPETADMKDSANTATIKNITGAAADNINKLKVAIKDDNYYGVSGFAGNFQEFLVDFQMEMALDKSMNDSVLNTSTVVISGYADRRDAVSAVSIDEEGINMMTYQNYYNAAARYMTTLDEALDKIINGMGTVGR